MTVHFSTKVPITSHDSPSQKDQIAEGFYSKQPSHITPHHKTTRESSQCLHSQRILNKSFSNFFVEGHKINFLIFLRVKGGRNYSGSVIQLLGKQSSKTNFSKNKSSSYKLVLFFPNFSTRGLSMIFYTIVGVFVMTVVLNRWHLTFPYRTLL